MGALLLKPLNFRPTRSVKEISQARGSTVSLMETEASVSGAPGAAGRDQEPPLEAAMTGADNGAAFVLFCTLGMPGWSLSFAPWRSVDVSARPTVPETAEAPNPPTGTGVVVEDPAAPAAKEAAAAGVEEVRPHAPDAAVSHEAVQVTEPSTRAVTALMPPPKPARPASKSEAGGLDTRPKKKRKVTVDPVVASLPSLFPRASELGPDVPEETRAAKDGVSEEMKLFCSAVRRVGLSMEPGFSVRFFMPCDLFCAQGSSSPRD